MIILILKAIAWGILTFVAIPTLINALRGHTITVFNNALIGICVTALFILYNI